MEATSEENTEKFWTKLKVLVFAEIKDAYTVLKQVQKKN